MDKYLNNIQLNQKPFENAITVNTRNGGNYTSGYAKPIQNLILGGVSAPFDMDTIEVSCIVVRLNSEIPVSGRLMNMHLLSEYTVKCVIGPTTSILEHNTFSWAFTLSARELYNHNITEILIVITGIDQDGNDVEIESSIPVKVEALCEVVECNDTNDGVSFIYNHLEIGEPIFLITLDGKKTVVKGTGELERLLEEKDIGLIILREGEETVDVPIPT